ncbi:hypothetical protein IWW46_001213 [Coemansia sp. RSA 2440]|nr:hypothetical protein IWW46_001213 [Coemansia sp. RSA 2440]
MSGFFASTRYAVVGASANKSKYGNKVLCWYLQHNISAVPINPTSTHIENVACSPSLSELEWAKNREEMQKTSVSVITPPRVSALVLQEAAKLGVKHLWFQPGSEPENMKQLAENLDVCVIGNGPCILIDGPSMLNRARL